MVITDVDKDAVINLKDETLSFKGKSENKEYELDIVFFKPVDAEGSTYKILPRSVQMHVMKKDKDDEEFWVRLLKDKALEKNRVGVYFLGGVHLLYQSHVVFAILMISNIFQTNIMYCLIFIVSNLGEN